MTAVAFRLFLAVCSSWLLTATARAELPSPVLNSIFPPGGQAGTTVTVAVEGAALDGLRHLHSVIPGVSVKKTEGNRFTLAIPAATPPGVYDLRALGLHGMSNPRAFFVSNRTEQVDKEPNDTVDAPQQVALNVVVNGRIDKPADLDCYRFTAKAGQRVVVECWARRIDSQLRAVLEVVDSVGKRVTVTREQVGIDPRVDFRVPADGDYLVKVFDLSYLGGAAHFYRLDIDTGPRVEFAVPCVLQRGKTARVKLVCKNLTPQGGERDEIEVELTPPRLGQDDRLPLPLRSAQLGVDAFAYQHPGTHAPVLIGVTDEPVMVAGAKQLRPEQAQEIAAPCAVSGQLTEGDDRHWYALPARKGEVFWLEAVGERMGSPVELGVAVLDPEGRRELAQLPGCLDNPGRSRFSTVHSDPSGRWVAPADGRYLILVRNLIGGLQRDPRRVYWLSVRREEPDFHLAVVSRRADQPAGFNLQSGGREFLEVLTLRRRGLSGPIRVSAENLPPGVQCPDTWIGPGQDRAPLVLTAGRDCPAFAGGLKLVGRAENAGATVTRSARGGTMSWPAQPLPSSRLTQEIPLATTAEANLVLSATPGEAVIDQEGILDVTVSVEHRFKGPTAPLQLRGVGLPRGVGNAVATIAANTAQGHLSFHFPETVAPGPYTFAVQAETEVPPKVRVVAVSNPITVIVRPARISLEIDPLTPRKIGRGKIIQLAFKAERKNGFIGKIHTELLAPGGIVGLRARGVTLIGQTETGSLQVTATETAALGRQLFLRLEAVGTVEDQPVYRAGRFVELEITE